jgi:hypothetical protein
MFFVGIAWAVILMGTRRVYTKVYSASSLNNICVMYFYFGNVMRLIIG